MKTNQIQILIAYDEEIFADGLVARISSEGDFVVVGKIKNNDFSFAETDKIHPDIMIFEFERLPEKWMDFFYQFSESFKNTSTLVITGIIWNQHLDKIMSLVSGHMLKSCSSDIIIVALHELANGGKYLCPTEVKEFFNAKESVYNINLSEREKEVLSQWILSSGNGDIAKNLNISQSTIRTHMKNIKEKIGITNKIELVKYICKYNILNLRGSPICQHCKYSC